MAKIKEEKRIEAAGILLAVLTLSDSAYDICEDEILECLELDHDDRMFLLEDNPSLIELFDNPTEDEMLKAVVSDGTAIGYIKNPSEKVQLAAVESDGEAIVDIENPSEAVQLKAIENTTSAIAYIDRPSEAVIDLALKSFKTERDVEITLKRIMAARSSKPHFNFTDMPELYMKFIRGILKKFPVALRKSMRCSSGRYKGEIKSTFKGVYESLTPEEKLLLEIS